MENIAILEQLILILGISLAAIVILRRFGIPSIIGFLLVGILIGPGGFGLAQDRHMIETIAEIGVILLLFAIGLKFSIRELLVMKWLVFGAGALQVMLTIVIVAVLGRLSGLEPSQAIFLGFLLAMSSTAIVVKLLEDRGETQSAQGRLMVSILLFQDLSVIVMMLLVPLLGGTGITWQDSLYGLVRSLGVVILLLVAGRYVFPWLLERVVHVRSREIFTLTTVFIALGTAYISGLVGLSLALGAFLAGVVISESEYSYQILSEIVPLRATFSAIFFVSVGMLLDINVWLARPLMLLGIGLGVLLGKALIVFGVTLIAGLGPRVAVLSGLGLAQIGEFSFILALAGHAVGLIGGPMYQYFISASVFTMALTPFSIILSPFIAGRTRHLPWFKERKPGAARAVYGGVSERQNQIDSITDHVIIVGYGINGSNVAQVLRHINVKYAILELNPDTVRNLRNQGEIALYGDASREEVLLAMGIHKARAIVISIADPPTSRQIVTLARRLNPKLVIIVRTRLMAEIDELYDLGADEVIPEEFETSLELADAVMVTFGVGEPAIERAKAAMRAERYGLLRRQRVAHLPKPSLEEALPEPELFHIQLFADDKGTDRKIAELNIREQTGATIIAVMRNGKTIGNPPDDLRLLAGDIVYLFGRGPELESARKILTD